MKASMSSTVPSTYASALRARLGAGKSGHFAILSRLAFAAIVAVAAYSLFAIHREFTEPAGCGIETRNRCSGWCWSPTS